MKGGAKSLFQDEILFTMLSGIFLIKFEVWVEERRIRKILKNTPALIKQVMFKNNETHGKVDSPTLCAE